jgi:hypothetical protein
MSESEWLQELSRRDMLKVTAGGLAAAFLPFLPCPEAQAAPRYALDPVEDAIIAYANHLANATPPLFAEGIRPPALLEPEQVDRVRLAVAMGQLHREILRCGGKRGIPPLGLTGSRRIR